MALPTSGIGTIEDFLAGLRELHIAQWNGDDSYGTLVQLDAASMYNIDIETISNELEGDDKLADVFSNVRSINATIGFGLKSLDILEVLFGTAATSGSGYEQLTISTNAYPYFSVVGKVLGTNTTDEMHIHLPKVKIMDTITFPFGFGEYAKLEIPVKAVAEGDGKVLRFRFYNASTSITIPFA